LIDRGDDVFWSATTELPNPQTFLPIVIAAVTVVIAPFFVAIFIATWQVVVVSCLGNIED